jgi:hypothetical protein
VLTGKPAGPLGLALLAVTAITGIVLAVHGWSGRHAGLAPGTLAGNSPTSAASGRPAPPASAAGPSAAAAGASAPAAGSSAPAATPGGSGASPAASPGPLLSAQSYAQYSFRVWPGTLGSGAQAALTGLSVKVRRQGSGITVTAGVIGQAGAAPHFFPHGAVVYVIEASMGDDSGSSDYSLGDDGLVVTDAHGRIVQ